MDAAPWVPAAPRGVGAELSSWGLALGRCLTGRTKQEKSTKVDLPWGRYTDMVCIFAKGLAIVNDGREGEHWLRANHADAGDS